MLKENAKGIALRKCDAIPKSIAELIAEGSTERIFQGIAGLIPENQMGKAINQSSLPKKLLK